MYGTQTDRLPYLIPPWFENDVKMYGTQTGSNIIPLAGKFENDVKMYGTQTARCSLSITACLRMM